MKTHLGHYEIVAELGHGGMGVVYKGYEPSLTRYVAIKELSATILLRPFGFNTLATFVYENASRGVPQEGAVAAILIILTALAPVVLLSGALMRDREAQI